MNAPQPSEYASFFQDKTVFLTGPTGNLGLCTLYKLVAELHPGRVFALVRGSEDQARSKIRQTMPDQANLVLNNSKVQFIVGDICCPNMGMSQKDLQSLQEQVQIVIHTAAVISLLDPIDDCVKNNCDPVLELARMATKFSRLEKFVFTSSVYANSFLPDGSVKEKIYPLLDSAGEDIDADLEREEISRTGYSAHTKKFAWPYALSKYLAERLLLSRFSSLPILIVRPSTIAPAIKTPFPLFGNEQSLPAQSAAKIYLRDPKASDVWHAPEKGSPGSNIFDEIPVDLTSNVMLLHIAAQTQGIVHASAGNFVMQTVNDGLMSILRGGPSEAKNYDEIKWIAKDAGPQCALANIFVIANRDWNFSCLKSAEFIDVEGPLSIGATFEQAQTINDSRYWAIIEDIRRDSLA